MLVFTRYLQTTGGAFNSYAPNGRIGRLIISSVFERTDHIHVSWQKSIDIYQTRSWVAPESREQPVQSNSQTPKALTGQSPTPPVDHHQSYSSIPTQENRLSPSPKQDCKPLTLSPMNAYLPQDMGNKRDRAIQATWDKTDTSLTRASPASSKPPSEGGAHNSTSIEVQKHRLTFALQASCLPPSTTCLQAQNSTQ